MFGSEVSSEVRRALLLPLLTEGYKVFAMKCSHGLQGAESLILFDCRRRHPQIVMSVCDSSLKLQPFLQNFAIIKPSVAHH